MKKALLLAIAVSFSLAGLSGTVNAASLTSGKKLEVNVDPEKVPEETAALWERFGDWCAIADWHLAVTDCEEVKEGDTTYRMLTLADGGKIKEKLVDTSGVSYRYEIVESPLPVKNYQAQFSIVPDDDDLDEVNIVWAATYDAADGKDDKEARKAIDGIFNDGIANIEKVLAADNAAPADNAAAAGNAAPADNAVADDDDDDDDDGDDNDDADDDDDEEGDQG